MGEFVGVFLEGKLWGLGGFVCFVGLGCFGFFSSF